MEENRHECPLRDFEIDDGDCFETVSAVEGMHSTIYIKKLFEQYSNCKEICRKCPHNKMDQEEDSTQN